ncbi:MAG: glycosyl transferase [Verrucomicrobia bacterium]|nr:glycosyl transferase [Verrucomicrobiota bacterium]
MSRMKNVPEWVTSGIPDNNAATVLSWGQIAAFLPVLATLVILLVVSPLTTLFILNLVAIIFYLIFAHYKLVLEIFSAAAEEDVVYADERSIGRWPRYTIMVPLYREESAVPGLVSHLSRMDYPADRLQILLLVEADDHTTRKAIGNLPPNFEVVEVPVAQPRTKPKACNYGMAYADGEYLVIFDAEDRPDTDQLKKAVRLFAASGDDVVCLQARLNFYNRNRNFLTKLFAAEYSAWFDLCLPGMVRVDAPIPLGGTSNHFRIEALDEIGCWDPFNVTEDCDLGIRIHVRGYRTRCLDSTTWEEATFRVGPWIRQRSRWIKGYLQTYLVHLRHHMLLLRNGRLSRLLHFHLVFGATVFCLLANPIYWLLTAGWFLGFSEFLNGMYPLWLLIPAMTCLVLGNAALILSAMLACLNRGYYHLVPYCLLIPFYWILMSIGAWKGVLQLITRPFFWEKTPHDAKGKLVAGGTVTTAGEDPNP